MNSHELAEWRRDHVFNSRNIAAEGSTQMVMWITAATMGIVGAVVVAV